MPELPSQSYVDVFLQANLVVQEARLKVAAAELNSAQEKLDEKQRELDKVQAMYDSAVREKQVRIVACTYGMTRFLQGF